VCCVAALIVVGARAHGGRGCANEWGDGYGFLHRVGGASHNRERPGRDLRAGPLGYVSSKGNAEFLVPPEWTPPSRTGRTIETGYTSTLDRGDKAHLDLWVKDGDSLESEVERLVALGATRVEWDYLEDADHVVLADPEGNLFCVCA
jgi:catechol 2,3-dioxygenase-like lactoylglutathione lyase family enzyme